MPVSEREAQLVVELEMTASELDELRMAKRLLENPGLALRIASLVGSPIEGAMRYLPEGWQRKVSDATRAALLKGLDLAIRTLGDTRRQEARNGVHKSLIALSGGLGAAGFVSLPVELPISTGIMLRSIADIARSEGHDLSRLDVRLACLEVLALGGTSAGDDAAESGYWAVRIALARTISKAAAYIAEHGLVDRSAPILVKFIGAIASRFLVVVTEEVAAKAIPVVGALSGGAINLLFLHHFQEMARGHFIVKRLEDKYGVEVVRRRYQSC